MSTGPWLPRHTMSDEEWELCERMAGYKYAVLTGNETARERQAELLRASIGQSGEHATAFSRLLRTLQNTDFARGVFAPFAQGTAEGTAC